ncbi:MAG: MFS transporter [Thermodesulfobacteriota bacterium]|jgi:EmrB/QacA subfamily drug resistance transporter
MPNNQIEAFHKVSNKWIPAYKWKAMATVGLGTMMGTMDSSITNISFPILTKTFDVSITTIVWVSLAFIFASTSPLLIFGRVGDLFGRKRIYSGGILIFTLGLIFCSLSQSVTQLIIFRIIQAIGSAMAIACGAAIVTEAFPPNERGMGLGLLAVSVSAGLISGPVLGGFLLGWLSWRSIFYVRIPLGLIVLIMAILFLKKDQGREEKIKFDLWGTLFSSGGLACFMIGVNQLNRFGLKSPIFYFLMGLGLLSLIIFVFVEKHALDPIVDLSLFKNLVFTSALGSLFLMFLTYSAYILLMPFYLLQGIGMTPSKAGVIMAVVSMTAIVIGPISGWLSDRFSQVWFATLGAILTIISFWLIFGFDLKSRMMDIIPALALAGLGMGMFQSPNNSSIMGAVSGDRFGTASAMIATSRQVGISLGTALAGTIYSAQLIYHKAELSREGLSGGIADRLAVSLSFSDSFFISAILMSSVVVLSIMTREIKTP